MKDLVNEGRKAQHKFNQLNKRKSVNELNRDDYYNNDFDSDDTHGMGMVRDYETVSGGSINEDETISTSGTFKLTIDDANMCYIYNGNRQVAKIPLEHMMNMAVDLAESNNDAYKS